MKTSCLSDRPEWAKLQLVSPWASHRASERRFVASVQEQVPVRSAVESQWAPDNSDTLPSYQTDVEVRQTNVDIVGK